MEDGRKLHNAARLAEVLCKLFLLEGRRLAVLEDYTYFPAPDLQEVIQRSCELDGSLDSERRQREYHEEERARFHEVLRKAHERKTFVAEPLD